MKMLWATKKGDAAWQEVIITTRGDSIPAARAWARANGFDRFRVAEFYDGEKPDFAGAVNPIPRAERGN